jgi:hypothetical protein
MARGLRPRGPDGARSGGRLRRLHPGKIDVQGPDAAAFLDGIYTGTVSTLAVGRVRYGIMLREDGFVMDDGTVARLAPDRFLVATTAAAAGQVLAHLEFAAQWRRRRRTSRRRCGRSPRGRSARRIPEDGGPEGRGRRDMLNGAPQPRSTPCGEALTRSRETL